MSIEAKKDMPILRPYQSIDDVSPDRHKGRIPRSQRTLSNAKRRTLREKHRIGSRKGGKIVIDQGQVPSLPTIKNGDILNIQNTTILYES